MSTIRDRLDRTIEWYAEVFRPVITEWSERNLLVIAATVVGMYALFAALIFASQGVSPASFNAVISSWRGLTFLFAAYAILTLGLNLHWGYTGLFNIGVAGFMAVGVYTMALLSTPPDAISGQGLGLPLPVGVIGGVVAAALVGLLAALPALRLRADYFAIVTLGFSEIIRLTANSRTLSDWTVAVAGFGTGGGSGIDLPARPTDAIYDTALGETILELFVIGGTRYVAESVIIRWTWVLVMLAFVAGIFVIQQRISFSPFGRVLKAIREDELVAQSLGKDTRLFKIKVFMLGCALMGLGGILWQGSQGFVSPDSFRPIVTFYVFIALIIGGSGSNTGSIVGAMLFVGFLFIGPRRVGSAVNNALDLQSPPTTFAGAVEPLAALQVEPFFAYALANIASLQFILLGVVLVLLVQFRPNGMLGHRSETAAAIDLRRSNGGDTHE